MEAPLFLCYGGPHKTDAEAFEALSAPTPAWAKKRHPTKDYLTSIEPAFVVGRLNQVFGPVGWTFEVVSYDGPAGSGKSDEAVVRGFLWCAWPSGHLSRREQFGGSANPTMGVGDWLKGAATDALTKCASLIGVASDIYGGGAAAPRQEGSAASGYASPAPGTEAALKAKAKLVAKLGPSGARAEWNRLVQECGSTDVATMAVLNNPQYAEDGGNG